MKTRLRMLRVGDRGCAWTARICHVKGEVDCHRSIRLRVWGAGKNSRALQVDLVSKFWPGPWGACATDNAYPTSKDVREVVDYALEHGWEPDAVGGTFSLTESEHAMAFELTDFLITDRMRDPDAPDPSARVIHAYEQRGGSAA
ncbi:hypothetical protein [Streptosporangium sp. 'caverna']|uniref:hypothetical protein n=1 Tax=Streptosporangium sp. 'caverna' TaxID=2202249 RepID=UPI000D7E06FD|nr:hypothetical protein [Streptosporangium sp. 'caverna']AWS41498.1 hypothetical protein DKM19_09130 [Streptosporangium sp. 'caverna']